MPHLDELRVAVQDSAVTVLKLASHTAQVQLPMPHRRPLALEALPRLRTVAVGEDSLSVRSSPVDVIEHTSTVVAREKLWQDGASGGVGGSRRQVHVTPPTAGHANGRGSASPRTKKARHTQHCARTSPLSPRAPRARERTRRTPGPHRTRPGRTPTDARPSAPHAGHPSFRHARPSPSLVKWHGCLPRVPHPTPRSQLPSRAVARAERTFQTDGRGPVAQGWLTHAPSRRTT